MAVFYLLLPQMSPRGFAPPSPFGRQSLKLVRLLFRHGDVEPASRPADHLSVACVVVRAANPAPTLGAPLPGGTPPITVRIHGSIITTQLLESLHRAPPCKEVPCLAAVWHHISFLHAPGGICTPNPRFMTPEGLAPSLQGL